MIFVLLSFSFLHNLSTFSNAFVVSYNFYFPRSPSFFLSFRTHPLIYYNVWESVFVTDFYNFLEKVGTKNVPWHILAPATLLSACDARLATTEVERRPLATSSLYAAVRILPEAFYIIGNAISYYIKKYRSYCFTISNNRKRYFVTLFYKFF